MEPGDEGFEMAYRVLAALYPETHPPLEALRRARPELFEAE